MLLNFCVISQEVKCEVPNLQNLVATGIVVVEIKRFYFVR